MKNLFLSYIFILPLLCFSQDVDKDLENLLKSSRKNFAPDKRSAVYDIDFKIKSDTIIFFGETTSENAKQSVLNGLENMNLVIVDSIKILPNKDSLGDKMFGIVSNSLSNIRFKPMFSAEMVTQLILGTPFEALNKKFWLQIRTEEGYIGWATANGMTLMTEKEFNEYKNKDKVIFTSYSGKAYSKPDKSSDVTTDLILGAIMIKKGIKNNFVQISFADGKEAFVPKEDVTEFSIWLKERDLTDKNIVETAKKLIGVPYLWGGTSSKMLDCSGFVKTVFFLNGAIIPRDASQQCLVGDNIDISKTLKNLKAGDLLFFSSKTDKITHVGIYIGDGQYIHSSTNVHISSLDKKATNYSSYYAPKLKKAVRILGNSRNDIKYIRNSNY